MPANDNRDEQEEFKPMGMSVERLRELSEIVDKAKKDRDDQNAMRKERAA